MYEDSKPRSRANGGHGLVTSLPSLPWPAFPISDINIFTMTGYTIVVDTREQKPLWPVKERVKLDVGDYSIKGLESEVAIERKSPSDLFATLGVGHSRFKAELERAQKLVYFAIVVDSPLTVCELKSFPGARYTKMQAGTILRILFTLHVKYGIPVFFAQSRAESRKIIARIFDAYVRIPKGLNSSNTIRKVDASANRTRTTRKSDDNPKQGEPSQSQPPTDHGGLHEPKPIRQETDRQ